MKNSLYQSLLNRLKNKHEKLTSRFHKSVKDGAFQKQRYRKRKESIERIKSLEKRIQKLGSESGFKVSLNYKHWAFALAMGAVVSVNAQEAKKSLKDRFKEKSLHQTVSDLPLAQTVFFDPKVNIGLPYITEFHTGDIDGDGDVDAVYVSYVENPVIFYNEGGFTFSFGEIPVNSVGTIDQTRLADFDGDGDLDFFVKEGLEGSKTFSVWLNDGSANFTQTAVTFPTFDINDGELKLADIDGDGDLDFVGESQQDVSPFYNFVTIFRNTAFDFTDTTAYAGSYAFNKSSQFISLMDADGDNDMDILYTSYVPSNGESLQVLTNNGSGAFTDSGNYLSLSANLDEDSDTLDIDNDGDTDLVVGISAYPNASFRPFFNNGTGLFTEGTQQFINNNRDVDEIIARDFNGDNITDLLINTDADSTFVLEGDGAGGFTQTEKTWGASKAADIDNDGDTDLFLYDGALAVQDNQGSGTFVRSANIEYVSASYDTDMIDIDGDGDLDIIQGSQVQSRVWDNDGTGYFTPGQTLGRQGYSQAFGDLDGDGDPDMIRAIEEGPYPGLDIWTNVGGSLSYNQNIGSGTSEFKSIYLEDMDGDSDLDVVAVVQTSGGNFLRTYVNNGGLSFALQSDDQLFYETSAISVGDLDGDFDVDVLICYNQFAYGQRSILNDGTGNLGGGFTFNPTVTNSQTDVDLLDADGDGDLDAFVTSAMTHQIWLNNGSGVFTYGSQIATTGYVAKSFVGDVDSDGDTDLLLGGYLSFPQLWVNDGAGTFEFDSDIPTLADEYSDIVLGDVDNDGDQDLVAGGLYVGTNLFINQAVLPGPEINVQGNGEDIASGDVTPDPTDGTNFGTFTIGDAPLTATFTIQNTGTSDLTINDITISGVNASDFEIQNISPPAIINGGSDVTFDVVFNGTSSGARLATIEIDNDDSDEANYTFDVTGLAQTPQEINLLGNGEAIASGDITPSATDGTDFDLVTIGSPQTNTFTIENLGEADLDINSINVSGVDAAEFTISNIITPSVISGLTDASFDLTFTPVASGVSSATVEISNSDSDESNYSFDVTGAGQTAQDINVQGNGEDILSGDDTPSLTDGTDFGSVVVGTTATSTFTIQNTGEADLTITLIGTAGGDVAQFSIPSVATPITIEGGSSFNFDVEYSPTEAATHVFFLGIQSDDADESFYLFDLAGEGIPGPEINVQGNGEDITSGDVTPDPTDGTDFGDFVIGDAPTVSTFTIQNTGTADLIVNDIIISGANASDFTVSNITTPATIAGASDVTFDVSFDGSASGLRSATLEIDNDDADEGTYTFDLVGNALTPQEINIQGNGEDIASGDITPTETDGTDFSTVTIGSPVTNSFTIQNIGEADLNISSIDVIGADATDFTVTNIVTPSIISGLTDVSFDVTYSPSSSGVGVATIQVNNDDDDEGIYAFDVTGLGQTPQEINVQGNGEDIVSGDDTPSETDGTDFGTVIVGTTATSTFTIQNTGEASLNISLIGTFGGDTDQFNITNITTPLAIEGGNSTTFDVEYSPTEEATHVFFLGISSDDADEALYAFDLTGVGQIDPFIADSTAVLNFYNSNNGSDWTANDNWGVEGQDLETWFGVTLNNDGDRVESIELPNNGLSGTLSNDLNVLDALTTLDLSNNDIDGLATDFSGLTSATTINMDGNRLDFGDLEAVASVSALSYANQQAISAINETGPIELPAGSEQTLTSTWNGTENSYQWVLNGEDVTGETGTTIVLSDLNRSNMGTYELKVTNSIATGETLTSTPIDVFATAVISVDALDLETNVSITENINAYLVDLNADPAPDTLRSASQLDITSPFSFPPVILRDYYVAVESTIPTTTEDGSQNPDANYVPTYYGDEFESELADVLELNADVSVDITMVPTPPILGPDDGQGVVSGTIDEDFGDEGGKIFARRRAAGRKCGLKKRRSGGRQDDDLFDLIAYGETNANGEFEYGFLPEGTYRFFVEYPGIPLDESAFVQFEIGEAGVSDDSFVLAVFASEEGIQIELVLGLTSQFITDFSIYPNPTSDLLTIEYGDTKGDLEMEMIDMEGKSILKRTIPRNSQKVQVDTSVLSAGQYLIKFVDIKHPSNTMVYRLIKK